MVTHARHIEVGDKIVILPSNFRFFRKGKPITVTRIEGDRMYFDNDVTSEHETRFPWLPYYRYEWEGEFYRIEEKSERYTPIKRNGRIVYE